MAQTRQVWWSFAWGRVVVAQVGHSSAIGIRCKWTSVAFYFHRISSLKAYIDRLLEAQHTDIVKTLDSRRRIPTYLPKRQRSLTL